MSTLTDEIARRRTFAIISHPDAGKTTLTEKLLLFGGAIQLAGEVKARGELICGANPGLAGFGLPDDQGVYKGLDVDECRAIAAAIFNDPNKVKYLPINAKDRPTIEAIKLAEGIQKTLVNLGAPGIPKLPRFAATSAPRGGPRPSQVSTRVEAFRLERAGR